MAAASSSLRAQIREELSCSICLELFTGPKVLPCQHTFCQDCLQDHAEVRVPFQCPICRRQVRLPRQGVADLPDNLMAASMCERLQNQATLSGETKEQPQSGNRCSFHPSEEVKLYCKQCNVPVCTECCEEGHDGHPTTGLKKAAQEKRSTVQALINEGRNILESYLSFLRSLREKEKTLNEQKQQRDNSIIQTYNQMVKTMMQKLTESKDHLLSESQQNHSENLDRIQTERDRVLADLNELSAACDRAEQELQQGWAEFLSQQTALTGVVGKYRGKAAPTPVQTQPAVFQPTDTPVPVLGHVIAQSLPSAPIPAASAPIPAAPAPIPAAPAPIPAAPAPIPAAPAPIPAAPAPIPAAPAPIPTAPAASFGAARGRGHHHGNQRQWEHQPQNVTFGKGGSGIEQFQDACGVTVSEKGEIFVADWGNKRIQVFTLQGIFVRQFPTIVSSPLTQFLFGEQKMKPHDVTLDGKGNLWVVGKTHPGEFAVQYNKQGSVLGKFDLQKTRWFRGVAVDTRRNHILITETTGDSCNPTHGEVLVFRPDGTLVRTVGQQQGMENPHYITVDGEGKILVSDYDNNCVYVYNEDGQFLFQFGRQGSGEGQLDNPSGICTDRAGNIIVADNGNRRVEMFDKTGGFLKHITTDMENPCAVAMATKGQLVVTDVYNTVSVFHNH
ncbi:TRIM3 [Branchiostoma lanceolatum]|uniref:RING-type E3 ubiquitin transferase n=1 Tax=Branchiostoma lanceolatum TaxID=7740 RepID=A0A8K0ABP6_BRALA|nr:TRIM3 [Branchiostoma lanceolatum]